jgi:hypothetical protein
MRQATFLGKEKQQMGTKIRLTDAHKWQTSLNCNSFGTEYHFDSNRF